MSEHVKACQSMSEQMRGGGGSGHARALHTQGELAGAAMLLPGRRQAHGAVISRLAAQAPNGGCACSPLAPAAVGHCTAQLPASDSTAHAATSTLHPPLEGQPSGGLLFSTTAGASSAYCVYSTMRSTLFMATSSSVVWRTIQFMMPAGWGCGGGGGGGDCHGQAGQMRAGADVASALVGWQHLQGRWSGAGLRS